MPRFNPDEYAPVEERIALFYADHPTGRILTAIERLDPPLVVFRSEVYRDPDDDRPWATGYAYEKEGEGHVNRTSYVENCETSAIGRALANAGYHGKRDGAPRPSREEMQKVERMGGQSAGQPAPKKQGAGTCPSCEQSEYWDNREKKASGKFSEKSPDYSCKDKEGCGWALWVDAAKEKIAKAVEGLTITNTITPESAAHVLSGIEDGDLASLRAAQDWIRQKQDEAKEAQPA